MDLTFEQHATQARALVRAEGFHDCIHYAPNWRGRADALYAEANALGFVPYGGPGLLSDGRMAILAGKPFGPNILGIAETIE
jgi:hypothetical protein